MDTEINGDGITYDIPYTEPVYKNRQFDQCVVYIRPQESWRGENFGFDWIRIGDTKLPGDIKYCDKMGRYYNGKQLIEDSDAYTGHTFKEDPVAYKKLIREYFPISYPVTWKRKELKEKDSEDKKNDKESQYMYYVPVMTLGKDKTANLQLKVEMYGKKNIYPSRIYLQAQNEEDKLFTVTGEIVSPQNKTKYDCSIKCEKKFFMEQFIDVIAAYPEGEEKLCGQLRVLPNMIQYDTIDILCINVETNIGNRPQTGNFSPADQENIEKILNQALLKCRFFFTNEPMRVDVNALIKNPNGDGSGKLIDRVRDGNFCQTAGVLELCLYWFESKLIEELKANIGADAKAKYREDRDSAPTEIMKNDIENKIDTETEEKREHELKTNHPMREYKNAHKIFFLGDKFERKTTKGDTEYTQKVKGYAIKELESAVIFANKNDETTAHELLHAIGLDHSFAPVSCAENALFTYRAEKTDNIMDYSDKRYNTWYRQWKILWKILFGRNYNDNTNDYA